MKLKDLTVRQLREQLEERDADSTGSKKVLQERLKETLISNGDEPETFEFQSADEGILKRLDQKFEEASKKSDEKLEEVSRRNDEKLDKRFEEVSKMINESSKMNDKRFEEVSRTFDEIHKNAEKLEEKIRQLEISITKGGPVVQLLPAEANENCPTNPVPAFKEEGMKEQITHQMRFKLPPFDGKSSWSIYLRQFEAIAAANHWTQEEKAVSLTAALRGDAADILRSIPKGQEKCYQTLSTRLEKRYGDSHLQQVHKAQLRNRVQRTSENLQEFEADVARMVQLAYPEAPDSILEEIAVDVFVNGLRESEIQKALRLARPKVLDEALAIALEHETASQTSKGHRIRTIGEGDEENDDRLEEMVRKIINKTMPKKGEPRCWNCGELGHLRRNCKKAVQESEN